MAKNSTRPEGPEGRGRVLGGALGFLWKSPWTGWVGLRYLKSKKHSRFLSFITVLSIIGIGLGVTAMVTVLSVMDGFEGQLKKRLMSSDLHVLITPTKALPGFDQGFVPKISFEATPAAAYLKSSPDVSEFWPILATEAILKSGRTVSGVVLKGIGPDRMKLLQAQIVESADPEMLVDREGGELIHLPGIYVGQELAYEMGVIPGDAVTLISPTETEGPMGSVPRLKRYVVEGVYHSGMVEQELHTAFATEAAVRSFLRKSGVVSSWEVTLKNFEKAPAVADALRPLAPGFKVQDWVQLNAHLFASLRLERVAMFIILALIVVVASFNIVTTLTLMVLEKTKEIAILKAMGARHGQVAAVFLAEGLLIGGLGVVGGLLFGFAICLVLGRYEFIQLPDVYYDRTLPVAYDARYYVGVALCAILIVLVACLYPSRRAARLHPLEGIRYG